MSIDEAAAPVPGEGESTVGPSARATVTEATVLHGTPARSLLHPREFWLNALVHHCEEVGVKTVPIVAVMAFLIDVVPAFQGAA